MLHARYAEGVQLTKDGTCEIEFLEDDVSEMSIICRVLHHHNDHVPFDMPIKSICRIAKITHQYDLSVAMRPMAHCWILSKLFKVASKLAPEARRKTLLVAAYYFK